MSRGSFFFTSSALRSLELDKDMLERHKYKTQLATHHLSSYFLKKEAMDRVQRSSSMAQRPTVCQDVVIHNALYTGDMEALKRFFPRGSKVNFVIEPQGGEMRWTARGEGLWSLTYEQELTTPLHITAGRGFADCLSLLLQRGANVDLAPGGNTALHEACESCQAECAKLLLIYGANPNAVSEDGLMPLHVCTSPQSLECAKYLLQYGATINGCTLDEDDSPLHIAARNGLGEHIELYLRHGASVDKQNNEGLTPLNAACARPQEMKDLGSYSKVLKHCSESPHTIEVLLNAYSHLKVTDAWVESVPEDAYKEHKDFYDSIFSLAKTPRSLQHLARCKLRSYLEGRVYKVVPKLDLPNFIKDYLLLECRGYVH
ncbi:PREDICTED: ankyrin repeat and SOCS box protein 16-like isoform X3 [Cyprinodon variegatus]|uniref:ankyrin repeat and SOCS box protein 16-like isoform X3 n=1 Tax=Cyprinodon variegatus TaxID=28743 RepID=UPI000742B0F5|nr:PREDICTED: ankyrin repeat and SOCS box protein 16-like isoform X3 [Cyprinodon variegatus]